MDVMRINKNDFRPRDLVEGYNSMIWTERFRLPGEFELRTHKIAETRAALELGSLISLRDSAEVMIVENHYIDRSQETAPELVVTGRSLTSFIEMRHVVRQNMTGATQPPGQRYRKRYKMKQTYTQAEAACVMLWNAFVSNITTDVTTPNAAGIYYREDASGNQFFDQHSQKDRIPNTVVTDSTTKAGNNKTRFLNNGPITEPVDRFLRLGNLGFRTIRPDSLGPSKTITVSSTGVITKTTAQSYTALRWDVYNGTIRTMDQTAVDPIVFRYDAGHLEAPTYLQSIKNYRTMSVNDNSFGPGTTALGDWAAANALSGLDRRMGYIDAGVYDADEGLSQAEWSHHTQDMGEEYLRSRMLKTIFDGKIAVNTPYVFKKDYFLGDTVTLQAEYDFVTPMQIIEYVRAENKEGEIGYPTLNLPEPEEL